mmetsp:Transcript_6540/g.24045  ORF Transcript_6540/g.24045 Transcript_6540/m.24045 type:complete len:278 (-) Transcript_6540:23-856(-)
MCVGIISPSKIAETCRPLSDRVSSSSSPPPQPSPSSPPVPVPVPVPVATLHFPAVSNSTVIAPARFPLTTSSFALSPTMTISLGWTSHAALMCSNASGAGLYGLKSLASAGANGARFHACAWKCATELCTFLVTNPRGIPRASKNAASSSAPGMRFIVRSASCSISWMIAFALARRSSGHASISDRMSFVSHPTRRYISWKSRFGTVSVPSMSNTAPTRRRRAARCGPSGANARGSGPAIATRDALRAEEATPRVTAETREVRATSLWSANETPTLM